MTTPTPDVFPYRRNEIDDLADSERYHIKIDARNGDGSVPTATKWMGITPGELAAIREVLREDKPAPTLLHRHPMMMLPDVIVALCQWCELTGNPFEFDLLDREPAMADVSQVLLTSAMAATWWRNGGRLAVVLLAGAYLAELTVSAPRQGEWDTNLADATRRVLNVVTGHLGSPTGYERDADLLARRIHEGLPMDQL